MPGVRGTVTDSIWRNSSTLSPLLNTALMPKRNALYLIISGLAALVAISVMVWRMNAVMSIPAGIRFSIIDGRRISLDELAGRPVIVNFWATTCRICRQELPDFIHLYRQYNAKGLEIIYIAMPYDPPNRVLDAAKENAIPFPVALDINGEAVRAFGGIDATPTLFLINPDGKVDMETVGKIKMDKLEQRIKALLFARRRTAGNDQLVGNGV